MVKRPHKLSGEAGLLAAVIALAVQDAAAGDEDAIEYFEGPIFISHITWLGLSPTSFPPALKDKARSLYDINL